MTESQTYSYAPKGDHLTIFKGKKKLHTPNGNVVVTQTPELAEHLIQLLEQDADHTSCATPLCYHYTYCDLIAQFDLKSVMADVKTCLYDNLVDDPMLLFRPEKVLGEDVALEDITEEQCNGILDCIRLEYTTYLMKCKMNQLAAIIVMYLSFDSFTLSWRIINDLIDNKSSREQFLADLQTYCQAQEIDCPENIGEIIDTFIYYYTL